MKNNSNSSRTLMLILCLSLFSVIAEAQSTKALNVIVPNNLIDERSSLHKTIGGIGFNVRVTMDAGIKYLDGCSDENFGELHVEIIWYDANDETGRFTLQMMKDMNAAEQDKQSFLGPGSAVEFAGGYMILNSDSKACINEITGPTGKTEFSTDARYFAFTGVSIIKISMSSKIKPETVKRMITYMVEQIGKADFSAYKTTVADEKD